MKRFSLGLLVLMVFFISCKQLGNTREIGCVKIDSNGGIISLRLDNEIIPLTAYTMLAGCRQISEVYQDNLNEDKVLYTRLFEDSLGNRCSVTDQYTAIPDGLLWNVEIRGEGKAWTTPVETVLKYPICNETRCWTSWSDCLEDKWVDPLIPRTFQDKEYVYGGKDIWDTNTISLPLFSILEKSKNIGITLLESPADTILDMSLKTSVNGEVVFKRDNYKISNENSIRLQMHLVLHNAEWKGGVNFLVNNYPNFFEPKNKEVFNVAGGGAYSAWEGEIDIEKLRKMNFSFNWRAGFDFPYMGLFLPKVNSTTERWERFHQHGVKVGDGYSSVGEMESYMHRMREDGFHVLCYFNITEVGNHVVYPIPPRFAKKDEDLWRKPNDFVYYTDVKNALVKVDEENGDSPLYSNWEGCVVVDPADPFYKKHLLEQVERHINYLPSSSGFCIDRLDWLRYYNLKGDDQVSWKNNRHSRFLLLSWKEAMKELGALMHQYNKVIFANVLYSRIDVMEYLDAIYDEYGQLSYSLNRSALLTLKKPLVAWTVSPDDFNPNPDDYFQRHLYLGAFLTVPYPGNDHTILPDESIETYYEDYGAMFSELKGRRWVLSPETFKLEEGDAKVNLFETDSTFVMPIVMGKSDDVIVALDRTLSDFTDCRLLYPEGRVQSIQPINNTEKLYFKIHLERKCALLIFNKCQ